MKRLDLTGQRYGRLIVIRDVGKTKSGMTEWLCKCDCGKEKIICIGNLRNGNTKSCGCYNVDLAKEKFTTHGKRQTTEYDIWCNMKSRCYNPNVEKYPIYGGAGIIVCDRWLNSFDNFYEDMGPRPTNLHTIDRYPNKKGNYGPGNCRWATQKQQQGNRTNNRWIEHENTSMILSDWARLFNINKTSDLGRYLKTHTMAKAFEHYKHRIKK